jgi:hypothetical protein
MAARMERVSLYGGSCSLKSRAVCISLRRVSLEEALGRKLEGEARATGSRLPHVA